MKLLYVLCVNNNYIMIGTTSGSVSIYEYNNQNIKLNKIINLKNINNCINDIKLDNNILITLVIKIFVVFYF